MTVEVALNTMWVLVAAFLVFFMQAGFALLEAGLTRAKNAGNIVMKNLLDFCVGTVVYWVIGFAIMYGTAQAFFGVSGIFSTGDFAHLGLSIPFPAFWMFQLVFAGTAATIVSGAMAERTRFAAYLLYSAVITGLIYPVVGHWIWGGGWLAQMGFTDFAGSTVVHSVGGWASLAGTVALGPRIGKYSKEGKPVVIPGHSLVLAALGVFSLWFGWFGFNPGSTLSAFDERIASIAVNTNIAAAAGALLAMAFSWLQSGKPDVGMTMNGVLAGLVGITAGCAAVSTPGALLIGAIAGVIVVLAAQGIERIGVDDPVGAIAVHAVCGVFGTLMVGLLALDGGLFYGGGWHLLGVQAVGVAATLIWTGAVSVVSLLVIRALVGLRVSPEEELRGLDTEEHGTPAYPDQLATAQAIEAIAKSAYNSLETKTTG